MSRRGHIIFLALVTFLATLTFPQNAQSAAGTVGNGSCASTVTETTNVENISTSSYCIFKFTTSSTTFTFPAGISSIDFLVIGGGGQGGGGRGGGGGAGRLIEGTISSPAANYLITVGAGGSGSVTNGAGSDGGSSSIGSVVVAPGGGGGGGHINTQNGRSGGSGGGAGMNYSAIFFSGGSTSAGTIPSLSSGYGNVGAASSSASANDNFRVTGGGGGAGSSGTAGGCPNFVSSTCSNKGAGGTAPNGGSGYSSSITGTSVLYAAGGGGAVGIALGEYNGVYYSSAPGSGGSGIGGTGTGFNADGTYTTPGAGATNTGSGGGGGGSSQAGGSGGSGVVIIKFTRPSATLTLAYPYSNTATYSLNATVDVATSTNSGDGTLSYSTSTSSSICTVNSGTGRVTLKGAGSCVITETSTATSNYAQGTVSVTLTINSAITLTPTNGSISTNYGTAATDTVSVSGGTGNKTLTLTNLTGETNISIDTSTANTAILRVGSGATVGTYSVSINATDSISATASLSITINVAAASAITITAATPGAFTYSPSGISLTNSYSISGLVGSDTITSLSYSYSQFSSCASGGSCQLGDVGPGGGRVFYDAGSTQSWGRYLELSPQGWNGTASDPTAPWCTGAGGNSLVGTQAGIGNGKLNTDLMTAACNAGDAANLANSYRGGGKTDWYLGNFQEIQQLVTNATLVGYTYTMHTLWVSWEWTANGAQDDVAGAFSYKNSTIGVRPIRAFDITSTVDSTTTNTLPSNAGTYYIVPNGLTLTNSRQSNYAAINYVSGVLTINRAEDSGFMSYSNASAIVGNPYSLYVAGGLGTGTVTYLVTGGSATGCTISGNILTSTSAGTCTVQFLRAQSTNYNSKSSDVTVTFNTYEVRTTVVTPPDNSNHGIVFSGGGIPWSKTATASPSITSITPTSGPVGTTITITGTGLNGVTVVRLNFEDMASVTGVSPTSVTAVVQSGGTSGPIYIENSYGADFNFAGFTVTP